MKSLEKTVGFGFYNTTFLQNVIKEFIKYLRFQQSSFKFLSCFEKQNIPLRKIQADTKFETNICQIN